MKKILLATLASLLLTLAIPLTTAAAQGLEDSIRDQLIPVEDIYNPANDTTTGSIQITIAKFIKTALGFLGVIAIILMLYGGFVWMVSRGNENEIGRAKGIISAAIVGAAIILVAFAVTQFVLMNLIKATNAD